MKVLYYNWVDYLDDENRGGGVSLYQRNILSALEGQDEIEANFLSSGVSHDLINTRPRWENTRHGPTHNQDRRFEIVNSGVVSPAHFSFGNPRQVEHKPTRDCFFDFIEKTGPYDVIHFNNLEGLPASVLELKLRWPNCLVVVSLHNYYPFCSQVNFWYKEQENCTDFDGGRKCHDCLPVPKDERFLRVAHAVAYRLKCLGIRPGSQSFDTAFHLVLGAGRRLERGYRKLRQLFSKGRKRKVAAINSLRSQGAKFAARRDGMIKLINANCDQVLCVSNSVARLATHFGLDPDLLHVSYIGTGHAERFDSTVPRASLTRPDGTVNLAFLGYMRRDKGFFFLLEALESLPEELAGRVRLLVAARSVGEPAMERLRQLGRRLGGLQFYDGYDQADLDALLGDVDLGVVPSLWNDNLPQVAVEMHARHIPLLVSDMGGARELAGFDELVFRAGDHASFQTCLEAVLANEINLEAYWAGARHPVSMQEHLEALKTLYNVLPRAETPRAQSRRRPSISTRITASEAT